MPAWHCPHRIDEVLLAWEGDQQAVFFDPLSGDTHLIAALGAQLAEWLATHGPLDRPALLQLLATEVDWDQQPDADALGELLDLHLQRLTAVHLLAQEPGA